MLYLTLDNLHIKNNKQKTYAKITTLSGEEITIFFADSKHKHTQIRVGIDCEKTIKINRLETDSIGTYPKRINYVATN